MTVFLIREAYESVMRLVDGGLPRSVEEMEVLLKAEAVATPAMEGNGSVRAWLRLEARRVFAKIPGRGIGRVVLTVSGAYENEVAAYRSLPRLGLPAKMFPRCEVAVARGNRFLLLLEDLGASRDARLPRIEDPHPIANARLVLAALAELHAPFLDEPIGWTPRETPFLRLIADHALRVCERRYGLTANAKEAFRVFVDNFRVVRSAWDSGTRTLVHGDAHLGNTFFAEGRAGFYDLQCVAREHPMRDVSFHLLSSCDPVDLEAGGESELVHFYVLSLNARLSSNDAKLDPEETWDQYRLHALWALVACVMRAGAGDLVDPAAATLLLSRVSVGIDRLGTLAALKALVFSAHHPARSSRKAQSLSPMLSKQC
ncbi:hypothetical protein CTAYLR_006241 [Chrysophaeum taylorii]|uniref:Aminoglycoside phosphotransferase domain-containing protein n=1 Tax=Chrysophaeum taylorii TaxID=2483200 RepID=A0AAD7XKN2_9STRA|nr:hypothetical protein CTAYLR_006241 [Chrysophaeum taylorii]